MATVSIATRLMSVRSFFDTNVLLYADDEFAPAKQRCSRDLVAQHRRDGPGVVSLQVLQEYFVNVTRKLHVDPLIARRKVEILSEFDVASPEIADILARPPWSLGRHRGPGTGRAASAPWGQRPRPLRFLRQPHLGKGRRRKPDPESIR